MTKAVSILMMSGALLGASLYTIAEPTRLQSVPPAELLPERAVVMLQVDGTKAHMPALRETAAWKALEDTQMRERVFDLVEMFVKAASPEMAATARKSMNDLMERGMSLAIAISPDGQSFAPYGVLVLHEAADMKDTIMSIALQAEPDLESQIQTRTQEGREISFVSPQPGMEVCLWTEGSHLVLGVGIQPADRVIANVEGREKNVTAHPLWNKLRKKSGYTVNQVAWVDTKSLMDQFGGMPFPDPPPGKQLSIREFCDLLGVAELEGITFSGGYKGVATWNSMDVIAPGPRRKLLKLLDQRNITFDELPPLPTDTDNFFAGSFDIRGAVDLVVETVTDVMTFAGDNQLDRFEQGFEQFQAMIGGHPRDVFSAGLGDLFCVYNDPTSMPIPVGIGPVVVASVADRDVLEGTLRKLSEIAQSEARGEFSVRESEKDDATFFSIQIQGGVPVVPTIMVTDKWIVGSLMPGAAQSFAARLKGRLKSWTPNEEVENALAALPKEYASITVSDPRPGYRTMMTWAPMGLGMMEANVVPELAQRNPDIRMPFGLQDLPSAQELVEPMFPNVSVSTVDESGAHVLTRSSVPGVPVGNVASAAILPVMVALLLPAVQQAREAARRTQSRNNMKQIMLAMHNHHDVYRAFPRGTFENEELEVEERLSWMYPLLPFIEQNNLYGQIDKNGAWNSEQNKPMAELMLPVLVNPSAAGEEAGAMDYVGISGIGPDSASLKANDPKAGIFGYDRQTRIRDITDGTSNTIAIMDSSERGKSYLQGGKSSIRGFSQQPYINGPDGIGGPHPGGVNAGFADGSVRFISENIDPKVLEALATKAGGEVVPNF
ncbi:MAG: DUF1559 domain-containing protein [Planctomycetaceae bacterium]|nr:DUF1559 domain-containing protein [Planctomycetaceae bacterium]